MRIGVIVPMTGAAAVPTWTEMRVGFEPGPNRPAADLTAAIAGFADAGVDDLICIVEPETSAGLKHLAAAAAGWLV